MECSCRLCPSPGMYAVTSILLVRRTRATLRRAEFGFLGVMILTCKHTPFFCGQPCSAGCFGRRYCCTRGLRTSWLMVGISVTFPVLSRPPQGRGRSVVMGAKALTLGRTFPARPHDEPQNLY